MARQLKILTLIDQFWPTLGGAEKQAFLVSRALLAQGLEVHVLTRNGTGDLEPEEDLHGLKIHRLPVPGVTPRSKARGLKPARTWLKAHASEFDLIHCHGFNPFEWSAHTHWKQTGKPYVVKPPNTQFLDYTFSSSLTHGTTSQMSLLQSLGRAALKPVLRYYRMKFLKGAARVLAISPEIADLLRKAGIERVAQIPNGINTDDYPATPVEKKRWYRHELGLHDNEHVVVFSGRLSLEKNLHTLLKAWEVIQHRIPGIQARLVILGGSAGQNFAIEDDLHEFIASHGLTNVELPGTVPNVPEWLAAADLFVLPSVVEGLSNALLEAISCGLPVIAAKGTSGNASMITPGKNGYLFSPFDHEQLANHIMTILANGQLRVSMGLESREKAVRDFSIGAVAKRIIAEYELILSEGNS